MNKAKETFLVHFVRLGVLNRIKDISESYDKDELEIADAAEHNANRVCSYLQFQTFLQIQTYLFKMCFHDMNT